MSDYNFDNFHDYDPIREEEERYARFNEERPLARSAREQRRRAIRRKRIINRTIVMTAVGLVLILLFTGISAVFKSCSSAGKGESDPPDSEPATETPSDEPSAPQSGSNENQNNSLTPLDFVTPEIADDNTDGSFTSYVYVYKNAGYTAFSGTAEEAEQYANAILSYKNSLPNNINVYNMIVPSATEMRLPKRLATEDLTSTSQADFIKAAYEALGTNVTPVNAYNALAQHNDEYVYFNTDSHWTALGAYYAYCEFAEAAGLDPVSLDSLTKKSISGFTGDYYTSTLSTPLGSNPDTVDYYEYSDDYGINCKMQEDNGGELDSTSLYYPLASSGSLTYGVFIWSDHPLFLIETGNTSGKNILVVKDSYGNPFVPYLAANYDSVHVIDYRRWDGNLAQYCTENNITDVLFINEISNAARSSQIDTMDTLFN